MVSSIVILFSGLRACGWDYGTYMHHFKNVPEILSYKRTDVSIELGYELFVSLCKSFFQSFNVFLFIFAGINIILVVVLCRKYSPYPVISFVLFCGISLFGQVMGQMRQPMAISMTYLIIIPLLLKDLKWRAILVAIIIGVLFHKSLLLLALFLPFAKYRFSRWQAILGICLCFFFMISSGLLKGLILRLIPKEFYLYNTIEAYMTYLGVTFSFSLGMLERLGLLYLCCHFGRKYGLYERNTFFRIMLNLFAFGVFFYFSFIQIAAEFASRGTKGLYFTIIFLLPILIDKTHGGDKKLLAASTIIWISYLYMSFLLNPPEEYNPYISVLD